MAAKDLYLDIAKKSYERGYDEGVKDTVDALSDAIEKFGSKELKEELNKLAHERYVSRLIESLNDEIQ